MVRLKSPDEIMRLREGGRRLSSIIAEVATKVAPGVMTRELDDYARELIASGGDTPAFLNYRPRGSVLAYPAAMCVSVNEEIVHGIPGKRVLGEGDIVSLDLGLNHDGLITDACRTFPVGEVSEEAKRLLAVTKKSLELGIAAAAAGKRTGDIGAAVESYVLKEGFGVVRDLSGHGVGYSVHEAPEVPNYGKPGTGERLVPGLVIAIEPMVVVGTEETVLLADGFTFITADQALSAHFEETVVITEGGAEILTS